MEHTSAQRDAAVRSLGLAAPASENGSRRWTSELLMVSETSAASSDLVSPCVCPRRRFPRRPFSRSSPRPPAARARPPPCCVRLEVCGSARARTADAHQRQGRRSRSGRAAAHGSADTEAYPQQPRCATRGAVQPGLCRAVLAEYSRRQHAASDGRRQRSDAAPRG